MDYDPAKLKEVMEQENLNWRSFAARDGVVDRWNSPATPTYYIIDHTGTIRHKWVGNPGANAIDSVLDTMIEEVEEKK